MLGFYKTKTNDVDQSMLLKFTVVNQNNIVILNDVAYPHFYIS